MTDIDTQGLALVTGTIIPHPQAHGKIQDPDERQKQYFATLKWMAMADTGVGTVIFCENSAASLSPFQQLLELYGNHGRRLIIRKVPPPSGASFKGKGWGEGEILRWALSNIPEISSSGSFVKLTGRHRVLNLKRMLSIINREISSNNPFKFVCQRYSPFNMISHRVGPYITTEVFWSDWQFYHDHILDAHETVDDQDGFYIEHAIGRRLTDAHANYKIGVWPIPTIICGRYSYNARPVMPLWRRVMEETKQRLVPTPHLKTIDEYLR